MEVGILQNFLFSLNWKKNVYTLKVIILLYNKIFLILVKITKKSILENSKRSCKIIHITNYMIIFFHLRIYDKCFVLSRKWLKISILIRYLPCKKRGSRSSKYRQLRILYPKYKKKHKNLVVHGTLFLFTVVISSSISYFFQPAKNPYKPSLAVVSRP